MKIKFALYNTWIPNDSDLLVFLSQVKAYSKPPPLVEFVMAAVMTMMGKAPDWATAKKALGESNFLTQVPHPINTHIPIPPRTQKKYNVRGPAPWSLL